VVTGLVYEVDRVLLPVPYILWKSSMLVSGGWFPILEVVDEVTVVDGVYVYVVVG